MYRLSIFIGALAVGAISWAVTPVLSGSFEPFDSGLALTVGQALMSMYSAYIGFRYGVSRLAMAVFGMYAGQVAYWYVLGSTDARAWALLGLFTTALLCVFPALAGVLGVVLQRVRRGKAANNR
jgi:hypothetical protein